MGDIWVQIENFWKLMNRPIGEWTPEVRQQAIRLFIAIKEKRQEVPPDEWQRIEEAWTQRLKDLNLPPSGLADTPVPRNAATSNSSTLADDAPGPFGEALRVLKERFDLRAKLQSGHFSTGYEATDRTTRQRVVLKLPAQEAWALRFDECTEALEKEAKILERVNQQLATLPRDQSCAAVVKHIDTGFVNVSAWHRPVFWAAQSFAQGQRLSDGGRLPMRGTQERSALHILLQLTGMVSHLYASNIAHGDLKPDCLFWQSETAVVEVIDWNAATQNLTNEDREREFGALQRLMNNILLGEHFRESGQTSANYVNDLFRTFSGTPLSRGTRMCLLRLRDARHPGTLRTVDELHRALAETLACWDKPLREPPVAGETTPKALSLLLNQYSTEVLREEEPNAPLWQITAFDLASAEVQKRVRSWLVRTEDMLPALRQIEEAWFWLPDVWPLNYLVPLARAWFTQLPREQDAQLAALAHPLATRQWEQTLTQVRQLEATTPVSFRPFLQAITEAVGAYQALEQGERLVRATPPDYAAALNSLTPVRPVLSLEPRVAWLNQQINFGMGANRQITSKLTKLADLRGQPHTSHLQHELFATLEELRILGQVDPGYATQQKMVELIKQAEAALAQARALLQRAEWEPCAAVLTSWLHHPALKLVAPDLIRTFNELEDQRRRAMAQAQIDAVSAKMGQALAKSAFSDLTELVEQAQQIAAAQGQLLAATTCAEIERLHKALPALVLRFNELEKQEYRKVAPLVTDELPMLLEPLVKELNQLVAFEKQLVDDSALDSVYAKIAAQVRVSLPMTVPLWQDLYAKAQEKLVQRLRTTLAKEVLDPQTLATCQAWLTRLVQVGPDSQADLVGLANLIEQRRDRQSLDQGFAVLQQQTQAAITSRLEQNEQTFLGELRTLLTPTQLNSLWGQVSKEIATLRDDVTQRALKDKEASTTLTQLRDAIVSLRKEVGAVREEVGAVREEVSTLLNQKREQGAGVSPSPSVQSPTNAPAAGITPGSPAKPKAKPLKAEIVLSILGVAVVVVVVVGMGFLLWFWLGQSTAGSVPTTAPTSTTPKQTTSVPGPPTDSAETPTTAPTVTPMPTEPPPVTASPLFTVTVPPTVTLGMPFKIGFPSGAKPPESVVVQVNAEPNFTQTIGLQPSGKLTLPPTLLLTGSFKLPLAITLTLGETYADATTKIELFQLVVGKVIPSKETRTVTSTTGFCMWKDIEEYKRYVTNEQEHAENSQCTWLQEKGQVNVLEGNEELYLVQKSSDLKVKGWIRKLLIQPQQP